MKIIALEEHFWTDGIRNAIKALPIEQQDTSIAPFGDHTNEPLLDLGEKRLAKMDEMGVDLAVLSVTTPATQSLAPALAVPLAREANDLLAEAVAAHPTRYLGFATLPTPDPAAAAAELERCVRQLDFRGALLNGRTGEKYLDHPDFRPLFRVAADCQVPVYIHPQAPPAGVQRIYYGGFEEKLSAIFATAAWGWHIETATNALRLILSGIFDELPTLQIILGHWGELLPFFIERFQVVAMAKPSLQRSVADYLRENFYVTSGGILSVPMLLHAMSAVGPDRILSAMDYPFVPAAAGAARSFLENAPISQVEREKIANGNASRLLKIK